MKPNLKIRLKRAFTENIGIKILALFLSIVLWMVVVNVEDPEQTKSFTVPVTVTNEEVLTEAGRYYTVETNTVTIRVSAKRSVIEKLTSADFTATADLNYLENDSRIPVTVTYNGSSSGVSILSTRLYLYVDVGDDMMTVKEIDVSTSGTVADGCVVSNVTVEPGSITMTGPEDVLNKIDSVVVYADIDGASSDVVAENAVLHFLDSDGNEIDRSQITVDSDTATVYVSILQTKMVDVIVETSGSLADGLELDSITVDPTRISIMGTAEQINDLTAITIPGTVVDLSQILSSTETTVDLSTYLPNGVSIASGTSSQATITITVSESSEYTYTVDTSNITIDNLETGLAAEIDGNSVDVTITGSSEDLASLDEADITGYVDVSGLSAGSHILQIHFDLDEDKYSVGTATVRVIITSEDGTEEEEVN